MKKIGILSDTHRYIHPELLTFFKDCDEIWHAGDMMEDTILDYLQALAPTVRAVYGNCDDFGIRSQAPEVQTFECEKHRVAMMHIGGSPSHYSPKATEIIREFKPTIFVTGHSHILQVKYDKKNDMLFINPGAAGRYGFHTHLTFLRMEIDGEQIQNMQIYDEPK